MEFNEQDSEVIRLLSKLKEAESTYPAEMMASRRQSFVKQIAALGLGAGAALALKEAAKAAGGSSIPPIASTIVEVALIAAIVAEASYVAFMNRQKVLDVFRTISGQAAAEQLTELPENSLPLLIPTDSFDRPVVDTAEPTLGTQIIRAAVTPSPEMLLVTDAAAAEETTAITGAQANSTPDPNGNNGNHYGQTPVAERTKEPRGGGGSDQNNNNDNTNNGNRRGR